MKASGLKPWVLGKLRPYSWNRSMQKSRLSTSLKRKKLKINRQTTAVKVFSILFLWGEPEVLPCCMGIPFKLRLFSFNLNVNETAKHLTYLSVQTSRGGGGGGGGEL